MSDKLAGKVAIVTGSSTGIGAGIARTFAGAGAAVIVNYNKDEQGARDVVASIAAKGGKSLAAQGDISKRADADRIVDTAVKQFGRLDILVNNAAFANLQSIDEFTEEFYRSTFDTNVLGPLLLITAALPHLREGSSIINIGSVATHFAPPGMAVYTASKGAVDGLTSVLANELGARGIRVNSLKPGTIATERQAPVMESDFVQQYLARTPLGRAGTPEEIGRAALFLASDDSSYITGDHIMAGGGLR